MLGVDGAIEGTSKHHLGRKTVNVLLRSFFFFRHHIFTRADHINSSGVERVLDMHPVSLMVACLNNGPDSGRCAHYPLRAH
jgi:hypothetical protein